MTVDDALAAERRRVERQVDDLARDLQAVIDASADANADDEHDPEGSTIGFERAQVASLLDRARARLVDLERAEDRLRAGTYGRCERCGDPIGDERLAAHPTATMCVGCATEIAASDGRPGSPTRGRRTGPTR
ncbi:MAG: DnaK suppressor protein [Actinomycetota bacterium]|nr:DnaK suppressor protein [Actinomycetota bacterium]